MVSNLLNHCFIYKNMTKWQQKKKKNTTSQGQKRNGREMEKAKNSKEKETIATRINAHRGAPRHKA